MRAEFSEFSYGFAVSAELARTLRPRLTIAPIFPSLRKEAHLGWDVKLPIRGIPYFIQFKLAEALTRSSAAEWRYYGQPYYRIYLHKARRSNQHNLLKNLANKSLHVYYVAPRFYRIGEF